MLKAAIQENSHPSTSLCLVLMGLGITAAPLSPALAIDDTIPGFATVTILDAQEQIITAPEPFEEPVAIFGPATFNDCGGGVPRMSWLGPASLEARYQEWEYLDGVHYGEEVDLLVLETGRYVLSDGVEVEVGSATIGGTADSDITRVDFSTPFPEAPHLFLTVQTKSGGQAVTARATQVEAGRFFAGLWEQEDLMDGHRDERVGYVAIYDPLGQGELPLSTGTLSYNLSQQEVSSSWTPTYGTWIRMEEERSEDDETTHLDETVALMELSGLLFAQDISANGADPATIRRLTMCNEDAH